MDPRAPDRHSSIEAIATLVIALINVAVLGWIALDLWQEEYVAPIVYPLVAALPVIFALQASRWWQSRRGL